MWLATQARWLYIQYSYKFFIFLWIFTGCSNSVSGNPSNAIVTKARCYANCLTKNPASNETEIPCQTNDCKECLGPCGSSDSDEAACKQICRASSSCLESCEFLTKVKNFSSLTNGDNFSTPTPGIPSVTNRSLNSISLKWEAVQNTTGSPVYMIEMAFSESGRNVFWPVYLSEVFVIPEATISLPSLCAYILPSPFRSDYSPILYKFRVAVLTENSSVSLGQQTVQTTLVKPAPVTSVTLDSLLYDPASGNILDRIKLNVSWNPPSDNKHLITKYAFMWELDSRKCDGGQFFLKNWETARPDNKFSGNVYSKAKRCNHHLVEVRSMIGCSASDKATLIYTYPGCQNITNFPKSECYKFDPPEAPIEDRVVHNIRPKGSFTVQEDYKFNVNITWDPPAYPYKNVTFYYVWLWEEDRFVNFFDLEGSSSLFLKDLLPRRTHWIQVRPRFADNVPSSERRSINFTTPSCQNITTNNSKSECYKYDPPDAEIEDSVVRNITLLTANDDYQSNMTIIWDPPVYKYRPVNLYLVRITMFRNNSCEGRISASMLGLHEAVTPLLSFMDPEPKTTYRIEVKPKFADDFPKSQSRDINFTIPDLNLKELEVNLKRPRFQLSLNGKSFDVNISWDEPTFNRKLSGYQVSHKVGNRETVVNATEKTHLIIPEVVHGEQFMYWVTPRYELDWLKGTEAKGQENSPVPLDNDVKVRKIEVVDFVPEKGNTTFSVKFSWIGPAFNVSVYGYFFKYELTGYTKHEIIIDGNVTKPGLCLPEIRPKETIRLKVRPIFENKNIKKIESRVVETAPAPKMELLAVVGLKHEELVPTSSSTFSATVKWEKPLFTQSNVTHYIYRTTKAIKGQMERRSIGLDIQNITTETSVTIDEIYLNEKIEFQVTPVFDARAITGATTKISVVGTEPKVDAHRSMVSMTPAEIAGLVIGFLLAALICMIFTWHRWREHKVLRKNGLIIDHWEVDGDLVTLEDEIGEGAFGKVYKGTLVKPTNVSPQKFCLKPWKKTVKTISGSETYVVAVKMLHTLPDEVVRQDFLEEIQLMKAVGSHKNIVNMVGCCTVEEPMFLLVEYAPYGDLLHYLRKHRKTACKDKRICFNTPMSKAELGCSNTFTTPEDQIETSLNTEEEEKEDCNEDILTPGNLMAFAWHICQGMEYLARNGYVHRDLAARNVLIGEKKIAKVSDFGLSRHVYEEKVYHCKRNKKLPFKWMSTEAIFDHTFTTKSDVWAFGVVLWEIATLGGTPYPTIESEELFRLLKNGYRMEKPDTCNEELYKMMQDCWQDSPENRPTFTQILESLETIMQKENPYLYLTAVDESQAEYNVRSFDNMAKESDDDQREDNVEVVCHEEVVGDTKENITKSCPQPNNLSLDISTKTETQMGKGSYDCAKNHQDQQTYVLNLKTLETRF